MALLKFNKAELVNLSYSLKREILLAGKSGAYLNTSIVGCNTRRYHGLLAVTLDRFGGERYLLLSSLDESLIVDGKQFNLGIHNYGDIYEPRGHKYVVDFSADPLPQITYKIGSIVVRKTFLLCQDRDQLYIRYELLESPSAATVLFKPLLAFRGIHTLTHVNESADGTANQAKNGASFRLYKSFPDLYLQFSKAVTFNPDAVWYYGITYSDEFRRGFDCKEDLLCPGVFSLKLKPGESVIVSASKYEAEPKDFKKDFASLEKLYPEEKDGHDALLVCANSLITNHNDRLKVETGYSWMYTGLLRETLISLSGLTLYTGHNEEFETILDNLIEDNQERLFRRTTQVEAPLYLSVTLQQYIRKGADREYVWKKYGKTLRGIIESYLPLVRKEVSMNPDGLLWAQLDGVALSWMNAYIDGRAVTERAGYQVETNALWYNAIRFACELDHSVGSGRFAKKWTPIADQIEDSFLKTFWYEKGGYLADYVDLCGQHTEVRPNQLYAIALDYSAVPEEYFPRVLRVIESELITARGIRTLSPRDPRYKGVYEGSQVDRDLAYHNGCAWPFLLEPYFKVAFKVKGPSFCKRAEWLTEGFYKDLSKHGVGAFSELYDGDPPFEAHGAISSALSTAALLVCESYLKTEEEKQ